MNPLEIIKVFGPPGIAGFLAGIALVALVRPQTNKGALFLILLTACIVMASLMAFKAIRGVLRSRKPPETPPNP